MTTSRAIREFLSSAKFERQLVRAYERYEILTEADLQTITAEALRRTLRIIRRSVESASHHVVTCNPRFKACDGIPDILIWKNGKPRFWVELKDRTKFHENVAGDDWEKLKEYCRRYRTIQRGYLIYVARRKSDLIHMKNDRRLTWIPIVLEPTLKIDFQKWEDEYTKRAHYVEQPKRQVATAG